jgi:hypothetical protein
MKKYIAVLMVAAFAVAAYAGNKIASPKDAAACSDNKAACCSSQQACCAKTETAKKSGSTKKVVMSPKAAGEVGK